MFCYCGSTEPTNFVFICGPWIDICIWKWIKFPSFWNVRIEKFWNAPVSSVIFFSPRVTTEENAGQMLGYSDTGLLYQDLSTHWDWTRASAVRSLQVTTLSMAQLTQ